MYVTRIDVPGGTAIATPVNSEIQVFHQYVRDIEIAYLTGAAGAVGVSIFDGDSRIYPAPGSPSLWVTSDIEAVRVHFDEGIELRSKPGRIKVLAYNTSGGTESVEVRIGASNQFMERLMPGLIRAIEALIIKFDKSSFGQEQRDK